MVRLTPLGDAIEEGRKTIPDLVEAAKQDELTRLVVIVGLFVVAVFFLQAVKEIAKWKGKRKD